MPSQATVDERFNKAIAEIKSAQLKMKEGAIAKAEAAAEDLMREQAENTNRLKGRSLDPQVCANLVDRNAAIEQQLAAFEEALKAPLAAAAKAQENVEAVEKAAPRRNFGLGTTAHNNNPQVDSKRSGTRQIGMLGTNNRRHSAPARTGGPSNDSSTQNQTSTTMKRGS